MMEKINSGHKVLRSTFLVVLIGVILFWVSLVSYQSFILRCQPQCAQVDLQGAYLHRPLTKADSFFELVLREVDFQGADFRGSDLRSVFIRKSNFQEANLENATLAGADLAWSGFNDANLRNANLNAANLYGASLRNADLRGADLRGAYLINTILSGAKYNELTLWPDDFDPVQVRAVLVE